ncbi:MAG: protein phosphatase CheZ [Azoarcus sp.]|nr:protein phosphatase CheZ [Azoarcus sp.]
MAKKSETGDSDDLQALFDSIAAGGDGASPAPAPAAPTPAAPAPTAPAAAAAPAAAPAPAAPQPPPAPAPAARAGGDTNDNDELQALFDSEASKFAPPAAAAPAAMPETEEEREVEVFNRIGKMTRKLHDMLIELGLDSKLQQVADSIPDARQRLTYVAQMTEKAASRVLNATDVAKPAAAKIENEAGALQARWDKVFANQLSVDEFKALATETRAFLGSAVAAGKAIDGQLMEIMMAQDFQDLTGQVIKKVVELAQSLESQLLGVLIESAPEEMRSSEKTASLLNGPVVAGEGRDDVVTSQGQVDDLLASLGF